MRFKAALLCLILTACGLNTGEKPPSAADVYISGNQYSCVGKIGQKVGEYLNAQMSDEQITTFVTCLQNAFILFSQTMHGHQDRNSFLPEEIRNFIQEKFLPPGHARISDELLKQFMVLKQDLVGGGSERIVPEDLNSVVAILDQIRAEALRLRPYIPYLNPALVEYQDPNVVGQKINEAEAVIRSSVNVFGSLLAKSQYAYKFSDFKSFLKEFRTFVGWEEHFQKSKPPADWVDLVSAFKNVAVSPGREEIAGKDWIPLLHFATMWHLNYVKFDVGIRNQPILEGNGFKNFVAWGDSVQELLNKAVERRPDRYIEFKDVDSLFISLKKVGWIPNQIRAESLSQALRALSNRVLGPEDMDTKLRASPGITKLTLANLSVEFIQWQEIQMALQEKYSSPGERSTQRLAVYNNRIPLLNLLPMDMDSKPHNRADWERFILSFQGDKRALFKEDYDRVFLVEEPRLKQFDVKNGFYNLSRMNIFHSAMDLIFKGYAPFRSDGSPNNFRVKGIPMNTGIAKDRLQAFYEDFRPLGIDLGFLDDRIKDAGGRTFTEAKIFTYLADGIDSAHSLMSYAQGIQEGAFLYSGGEMSRDLYKKFASYCRPMEMDRFGNPKLERDCVRSNLVTELIAQIGTMPYYTEYLRNLTADLRLEYADNLLKAAYGKYADLESVELSELATVSIVVHYSEALMTHFNTSLPLDDRLSESEIDKALPIFTGLIRDLAPRLKQKIDSDARAANVFKFILANGRLPTTTADKAGILCGTWCGSWGLDMDRMKIARVFAAIIQNMMGTAPPEPEAPPDPSVQTILPMGL